MIVPTAAALLPDARRVPRDTVSFHATLDGPAEIRAQALVVDISPLGFMARCTASLAPGDAVSIRLPLVGTRSATVIWSICGRLGGEFAVPIPREAYIAMLSRAPRDKPAWNEF